MNAPLTFDFANGNVLPPTPDQSQGVSGSFKMIDPYSRPKWRASDPSTSHEAAVSVKPGNSDLIKAIRDAVENWPASPSTAFQIARRVEMMFPRRWKEGSIRTRVSALEKHPDGFLEVADENGSEGGCSVRRYRMRGA